MKKFLVSIMSLIVFAVMLPMSADAQSCKRKSYKNRGSNYGVAGYRTTDETTQDKR
jgi:hypothetical protein